jgi:hypothetical protein
VQTFYKSISQSWNRECQKISLNAQRVLPTPGSEKTFHPLKRQTSLSAPHTKAPLPVTVQRKKPHPVAATSPHAPIRTRPASHKHHCVPHNAQHTDAFIIINGGARIVSKAGFKITIAAPVPPQNPPRPPPRSRQSWMLSCYYPPWPSRTIEPIKTPPVVRTRFLR